MYRLERTVMREERYWHERDNPSFSSTLLDKIYRSIDDGTETKHGDMKFYRETMQKKQSKCNMKSNRCRVGGEEDREMSSFQRACLIEKWMEKKVGEKVNAEYKKQVLSEFERKSSHHEHEHDHDHDVLFNSSTSASSSDSSFSGGLSSSDTDSLYGSKTKKVSCFVTSRPKPVRTSMSARSTEKPSKTETKQRTLFYEQRELHMFDDYHYNSVSDHTPKIDESLFKSKSRAMKLYGNLKKVKQPISPGGRLAGFINSLFTTGNNNTKKAAAAKSSSSSSIVSCNNYDERKLMKSGKVSTCSSASSFSRSCLSKNSPSTRERLRNGVKRTVRFVDEDRRPCGQKCLYEEDEDSSLLSVSVPKAWKIGKSPSKKCEEEVKFQILEKSKRVEEMAREFLKEYHLNQKKNDPVSRDSRSNNYVVEEMNEDEDDDDDDAASYSSSDLFELDLLGNYDRYREELPVYETTRVVKNRAIANGLRL